MSIARTKQKKDLWKSCKMRLKMAERFKRKFSRMIFDNDTDFNNWVGEVGLGIDRADRKKNSLQSMP